MSKFSEACRLSYLDWLSTLPDVDNLPEPEFSKKYIKQMEKLLDKMRGDKYHYFTRKTVKVMVVAAVLAALMLTAFVIPSSREYIIENFDIFGVYEMTEHNNNSVNGKIEIGYIPDGYELVEESRSPKYVIYMYQLDYDSFFRIYKYSSSIKANFNLENGTIEKIMSDNTTYYYSTNTSSVHSLIWSESDYIYQIEGSCSKEELIKIAKTVK